MRAAGGSLFAMLILSHLRARRCLDAAGAEGLLAGRGVPAQAPAGRQALPRLPEIAAGPGSERELAREAAAAAFVQVVSPVRSRRTARRVLEGGARDVAAGGTAVRVSVVSRPLRKMSPSGSAYSPRTMLSRVQLSQESGAAAGPPSRQPECPASHGRPVTGTLGCRPRLPAHERPASRRSCRRSLPGR
jgi:hypothetical protein